LWGKAALLAAAAGAVCLPASFAAFLAGQSILGRQHLAVSLSQPGVARAVVGGALYLAVAGLLGLGLGTLLRSTAGGISALFGLLFGLQLVGGFLPGSWSDDVGKYMPAAAPGGTPFTRRGCPPPARTRRCRIRWQLTPIPGHAP
jgi:ABC-2 type transport system permease protein